MARPRTEQVLYITGIASNLLEDPFIIFGPSFFVIRKRHERSFSVASPNAYRPLCTMFLYTLTVSRFSSNSWE